MTMANVVSNSEKMSGEFLARALRLARVSSWLIKQTDSALPALRAAIIGELVGSNRPLVFVQSLIRKTLDQVAARLLANFREISNQEFIFSARVMSRVAPTYVIDEVFPTLPDVLGHPFKVWFDKFAEDLDIKIVGAIKVELATGQIQLRPDFLLDYFGRTMAGLDALIRTYVNRIQNFAIREVALAGIPEFQWVQISILDARTTQVCRDYAQLAWSKDFKPIDHEKPFQDGAPRHWNCRSLIVPLLPDDDIRELTFDDWLNELNQGDGDRLFGKVQHRLYKRKTLSLSDMVRQANRPLEVSEL
jgi:hypothetical protein